MPDCVFMIVCEVNPYDHPFSGTSERTGVYHLNDVTKLRKRLHQHRCTQRLFVTNIG